MKSRMEKFWNWITPVHLEKWLLKWGKSVTVISSNTTVKKLWEYCFCFTGALFTGHFWSWSSWSPGENLLEHILHAQPTALKNWRYASGITQRNGSTVLSDILWADVNSCHLASSICSLRPTDCSTHQNKLRRPQFRHPRTSCMEQSSCCTASTRHYTDNVQEQTEDIFVQCVTVHTAHLQLSSDFALYKCCE